MEQSETMQNQTSWLSAICAACGILLLAAYILWSPDNQDKRSTVQPEKLEIQRMAD